MSDLIKKYAKGTPKPYAVPMTKKAATEEEAGKFVNSCGDRKAIASKVEGGYVIHYRRWFDDFSTAQAFVASMRDKKEKKELEVKIANVKSDLQVIVGLMEARGKKDLAEKTKGLISKL